jgi:hypothetical protein
MRRSHENPSIQSLYKNYLSAPGSSAAHALLHTRYTPRVPEGPPPWDQDNEEGGAA